MSENLVYSISCRRCSDIYIGETRWRLRSRFGEHLRSIGNNTPRCSVARQVFCGTFQLCRSSITDVQLRGMRLCRGNKIIRKQREMKVTFQLGTLRPDGLNINFKYVWPVRALLLRASIQCSYKYCVFQGLFYTPKMGYTPRNFCVSSQFWNFLIISNWNINSINPWGDSSHLHRASFHLALPRGRGYWKPFCEFAFTLSSVSWKVAIVHQRARAPHLFSSYCNERIINFAWKKTNVISNAGNCVLFSFAVG